MRRRSEICSLPESFLSPPYNRWVLNSRFCGASVVTMLALYGVVQVPNVVVFNARHERMGESAKTGKAARFAER